jgi:histidinol-phosphate aminotransferase
MRPLVPPYIQTLKPYVPGKPIPEVRRELGLRDIIKLASNENPLGPSKLALQALREAAVDLQLYPDGTSHDLVEALSRHLKVPAEQVFVGSGSNEIIELCIRTFTVPEDVALLCQGSFLMYKVALGAHGRRFVEVPMQAGFRYDLKAMAEHLRQKPRLVFLANPDNPTGTAFGRGELEAFLAKVDPHTLVVLDEAYFEFVRWEDYPNGLSYLKDMPNLVVLRTFSKIYGLAGARVGYGVMRPELVAYLHRTRMPFNVTSVAQAAGIAALKDEEHLLATRELNLASLAYLHAELARLGLFAPKSHANFVFVDFGRPAPPIYEALLKRGIITRPVPGYGFPNALRISTGLKEQNERLVAALFELRGRGKV